MKKVNLIIILLHVITPLFSQADKFKYVDEVVAKVGAMLKNNVAEVAEKITKDFNANEDKARAIYYWITNNIAIDPKATKQNEVKNTLPEIVI